MAQTTSIINGTKFQVRSKRGFDTMVATVGSKKFFIAPSSSEFFTGFSWSIADAATGRPVDSSVGKIYFPTPEEAFTAALKA
jgi:hypothetical protein